MYMFTQKESQHTAQLLWHDWFPSVWLDEHQMGSNGARIFVMPATDPINPNVHPLIYRWNGILGQSQAAALEAAGKEGIIYNSTYTNFWEGAMAWSGWWHNQIGLLTEVASARVAAPIDQQRAVPGAAPPAPTGRAARRAAADRSATAPLPAPTDITPRTEYPRPWMGGHWTLRDIVDYELIATMALLETAADRRETILRQIYEVNRQTIEDGKKGNPSAILVPVEHQHDAREAAHLVERLAVGGDWSSSSGGEKCAPRCASALISRAISTSSAMTSADVSCWLVYFFISSVIRSENARCRITLCRVDLGGLVGDQLPQRLDGQLRVRRLLGLGDELRRQVIRRRLGHAGRLVDVQHLAGRRRRRRSGGPATAGSPPAPARRWPAGRRRRTWPSRRGSPRRPGSPGAARPAFSTASTAPTPGTAGWRTCGISWPSVSSPSAGWLPGVAGLRR